MWPFTTRIKSGTDSPFITPRLRKAKYWRPSSSITISWGTNPICVKVEYSPDTVEPIPVFRKYWSITLLPLDPPRWAGRPLTPDELGTKYTGPWYAYGWWGKSTSGYDRMDSHFGLGRFIRFSWATPNHRMHWLGTDEDWLKLVKSWRKK